MAPNLSQINGIEGDSQSGNELIGNLHHKALFIWTQFLLAIQTTWKHSKGTCYILYNLDLIFISIVPLL